MLGALTFYGFYLIFSKLPLVLQVFLKKHKLLSDAVITIGGYFLLAGISSSIVTAVGSAVNGILTSLFTGGKTPFHAILSKFSGNNKQ